MLPCDAVLVDKGQVTPSYANVPVEHLTRIFKVNS